jgi:transposase
MDGRDKKLALVRGDVVIWGVDIAKVRHWARPVRPDQSSAGKAMPFENNRSGFERLRQVMEEAGKRQGASRAVVAMEPTGSYWRPLAGYLREHGYAVVLVNPFHVKQEKERSDNTPSKNDRKDCRIIAELAARGDYLVPIFPRGPYAVLREMTEAHKEARKDKSAAINRIWAVLGAYFPELPGVFKDLGGKAAMWVLGHCPTPEAARAMPLDELVAGLKAATSRRVGAKRAAVLVAAAQASVGVREGAAGAVARLAGYVEALAQVNARLERIDAALTEALAATGLDEVLCSLPGIGPVTAAMYLGEIGDLEAFSRGRQVVKLAGFQLAENSSGRHEGQSRIAKRGRAGLRQGMHMAALGVIQHCPEFRARYEHLKGRAKGPLRKPQALVAVAMQLIRVLFAMAKARRRYEPGKLMAQTATPKASAA